MCQVGCRSFIRYYTWYKFAAFGLQAAFQSCSSWWFQCQSCHRSIGHSHQVPSCRNHMSTVWLWCSTLDLQNWYQNQESSLKYCSMGMRQDTLKEHELNIILLSSIITFQLLTVLACVGPTDDWWRGVSWTNHNELVHQTLPSSCLCHYSCSNCLSCSCLGHC